MRKHSARRAAAKRGEAMRERRKRRRKSRFTTHYSFPVFVFSTLFLHSVFRPFTACQQISAQANFHFENIEETIRLCPIVCIIPQNPLRGGKNLR